MQPSGAKGYCAIARNRAGQQTWTTIGATDVLPIAEARIRAREIIQRRSASQPVLPRVSVALPDLGNAPAVLLLPNAIDPCEP